MTNIAKDIRDLTENWKAVFEKSRYVSDSWRKIAQDRSEEVARLQNFIVVRGLYDEFLMEQQYLAKLLTTKESDNA